MKYIGLRVYYKDVTCIKYRQDTFMTWDTMLAAFGGIFALCLGGSVISLIEFLYWFTFKLYHNFDSQWSTQVNPMGKAGRRSRARLNYAKNGVNLGVVGQQQLHFNVANKLFLNYPNKYGNFLH